MKGIDRILTLRNWRVFRGKLHVGCSQLAKMEGVDLYGDLEDPFFFGDQPSLSEDQVKTIDLNTSHTHTLQLTRP